MKYPQHGPYGYMPTYHELPEIKNRTRYLPDNDMPRVYNTTFEPPQQEVIDIDEEQRFCEDPINRSLTTEANVTGSASSPENVIKLSASQSKKLDANIKDLKSEFLSTLLDLGASSSLAYEEASAEAEAIIAAKFGVSVEIDSDVLDYINAILDADVLARVFSKTSVSKDIADKILQDFITTGFNSVRSEIRGKRKSDFLARYKSSLNNMHAETEDDRSKLAISKGRK